MDQNLEASYYRSSILKDCNEEEPQPSFDDSCRALWGKKPIRVRLVGIRTGSAWPALVAQAVQSVQIPSSPQQVAHWAHDQEHRESPN